MAHPNLGRTEQIDSNSMVADLLTRQYLQPHRPVADVLSDAQREIGFCAGAGRAAVKWLGLDPARAIGRLRRTELIQLARSIHRFWRQGLAAEAPQPQAT